MKIGHGRLLLSAMVLGCFAACGGGGGEPGEEGRSGVTVQQVLDRIAASTADDVDGDGLPADVEEFLGTDPEDRDTDHDSLPDLVETMGLRPDAQDALVPDRDHDGVIAPLDEDDNGDDINDGMQRDSDGDTIVNYLEYYGFTYNWMTEQYLPWDGVDHTVPYYKTDPYQRSTDQDPFDDNVEVSRLNMDVSVKAPGNQPMVPAAPDIVVRLEGYSVTLDQSITWTREESLAEGSTWQRSTTTMHSFTDESNWEMGTTVGMSISLTDLGGSTEMHANYGGSSSSTESSTYAMAVGGSMLSQESWSQATTTNPTDAAHIKLFLKVQNRGTAAASNVIPTLTLKIGGHNIATFEPGNAQINLLQPGDTYPDTPGVYWVVDSIDTGASIVPIELTLGELKALESGAPVSLTVTQVAAEVMQKDPDTGAYASVGDWNEYLARIEAVSARVLLDLGDGTLVRSFVYAGDTPSAPLVTLADALVWAAGGHQDPDTGETLISYRDRATGTEQTVTLEGWKFAVDGDTYRANGFSATSPPPEGYNLATLLLRPGSVVVAKAPRSAVPDVGIGPTIHYAYYDPVTGGVNVVPSDYNGIAAVEFIDQEGEARPMTEDIPGSSFYTYFPNSDLESYPQGYTFSGAELVRVTNIDGLVNERWFIEVFVPDEPEPPTIMGVHIDLEARTIRATIESEVPLDAPPAFVRAYHPGFATDPTKDDFITLKRVSNFFEDPNGWWAPLPESCVSGVGIEVVAYLRGDIYTTYTTTAADEVPATHGVLGPLYNWFGVGNVEPVECVLLFCWANPTAVSFWGVDLDENVPVYYSYPAEISYDWRDPGAEVDVWFRASTVTGMLEVLFQGDSSFLGVEDQFTLSFDQLTPANVLASNPVPDPWRHELGFLQSYLFGYRTNQGRLGKLRVIWSSRGEWEGYLGDQYALWFVTFN